MAEDMNMEMDMDYGVDILTLVDEDGEEHEFEILDQIEEDGENYVALLPVADNPDEYIDADGELVILKVDGEGEDEALIWIEDEEEFARVSDIFMQRLSDEFDFEMEQTEE